MHSLLQSLHPAAPAPRHDGNSSEAPPSPAEMFARLGLLIVIALGLALAAQLLVAIKS